MATRWLDDEERALWMRLQALSECLPPAVEAQLRKDAGLTRYEYYVLAVLSEAPTRSRLMADLAAVTNGSLSRLSHAAAKLEANGWITRDYAPGQRRSTVATLTDAGWRKVVEAAPGHVTRVRELLFDRLTPEQTRALLDAIQPLFGPDAPHDPAHSSCGPDCEPDCDADCGRE
ncbi:MarR family transcriptional regulator [Streptomyces sp. NPDC026672]|uniref:MarR family winged helix-turn-helix transcriptional regulator n=1 Tax=unclassified Streptomyces TaxID=2593676 RepID=UPI003403027F